MMILRQLLAASLVVLLAACGGIAVNTDYDTSRDLSQLKTYAWLTPEKKLVVDPLVENDLMDRRVKRAVEQQLAAQGFRKASGDEGADFLVNYHVVAEDKLEVDTFYDNFGYYPCWGCYYGHPRFGGRDVTVRQYKQGTFMLDVVDPASKALIWRGVAGRKLNNGTPAERDAYVNGIVTAILAKFPPAA